MLFLLNMWMKETTKVRSNGDNKDGQLDRKKTPISG